MKIRVTIKHPVTVEIEVDRIECVRGMLVLDREIMAKIGMAIAHHAAIKVPEHGFKRQGARRHKARGRT